MMEKNVGTADAVVRLVIAAVLAAVAIVFVGDFPLAALAALGAIVMTATAVTGRCPLYRVVGISTCGPRAGDRRVVTKS